MPRHSLPLREAQRSIETALIRLNDRLEALRMNPPAARNSRAQQEAKERAASKARAELQHSYQEATHSIGTMRQRDVITAREAAFIQQGLERFLAEARDEIKRLSQRGS